MPESIEDQSLEDASARFATEIQETLDGVLPGTRTIVSRRSEDGTRFLVQPEERRGLALLVGGECLAQLSLTIYLGLDRTGRYLKAVRSDFVVSSVLDRTPLIRLDYRNDMTTAAVAHWQVHAERGAFSHLLARAHAMDTSRVGKPHELSSLHIPVGGERYRPCLEDLLHFLVQECGVDRHDEWLAVVEEGRERWRRRQLASAVRDAPAYAATVLQELGWTLEPPQVEPAENVKALRRW